MTTDKFKIICTTLSHIASIIGGLVALKIMFDGLAPFAQSSDVVISAMTKLINEMNISNITGYVVAGIFGLAWNAERNK
jgi:hypothetical protein